jgi:phage FluMu protein Com
MFQETKIKGEEPDAIIFNIKNKKHKLVWYKEPNEFTRHISSKIPKGKVIKNFEMKEITLQTNIYINKDNKYQIRI